MEKNEKKIKLTTRRIIVVIVAIILLFLIIFGICKLFSTIFGKEKSYGNASNKGLTLEANGTIYYNKYDNGIVKLKGRKETQITDEVAYCITMYENRLYYMTVSANNTIDVVSVNTDGEEYQKIKTLTTKIDKFYIEDGYLYYYKIADTSGIVKLSLDTGDEVMITSSNVEDFILENGVIYFSDSVGFLHSVKTNGSDRIDISKDYQISKFQIMGKWIYFYDSNENALCKIKKDGSGKTTVATFVNNSVFNITNKNIYYLDKVNKKICKCDLKGKQSKEIVTISVGTTNINIVGNTLYYLDKSKDETQIYQMYRVKTNGKATSEITY